MSKQPTRGYPRRIDCDGSPVEIARMTSADRDALVAFVATLSANDLLFVRRDISRKKVIDAWLRAIDSGEVLSLVARDGGAMVGCTALVTDELSWSKHVGELRVLVSPAWRGKGLGLRLFQHAIIHARNQHASHLMIHALTENAPMLHIAAKAGALIEHHGPDAEAWLKLPPDTVGTHLDSSLHSLAAELIYRLKYQAMHISDWVRTLFSLA